MARTPRNTTRTARRTEAIGVSCSPEFRAWVDQFAEAHRLTPTVLVEIALVELARARDFMPPPKR